MKRKARAKTVVRWEQYSPASAPHVRGRWTVATFDEDGLRQEQRVEARCFSCETPFRRTCSSGLVQQHVDTFARVHQDCGSSAANRARWSTDRTPEEQAALEAVMPAFMHGTMQFTRIPAAPPRPYDREPPADFLTPDRARHMLALVVKELAPLYQVSVERLDWLAQRMLMLDVPHRGSRITVQDFVEGRW